MGADAAGEEALSRAEQLLMDTDGSLYDDVGGDLVLPQLRAIASLHEAVKIGSRRTVEAAVNLLLVLLRAAEGPDATPVIQALGSAQEFPPSLAANAARLIMLKPEWPDHGPSVRKLCEVVAKASPLPVVTACLDLVPRSPGPDTL